MAQPDTSRSVEERAQALYEASDSGGIGWTKRSRIVREPWLEVARLQIAALINPSES